MGQKARIRRPAVAGSFYPGDAAALRRQVTEFLDNPAEPVKGARGLVAPHAGYMFSGQVAGQAYAAVRDAHPDVVVVISPSHREYFAGISIYDGTAYRTPLGEMPVPGELRDRLQAFGKPIVVGPAGHGTNGDGEHAIEVQLPFLQILFGAVPILPIVMGEQSAENCEFLAKVLAESLQDRQALVVASSDLSHYHPYEIARSIDSRFIEALQQGDPQKLWAGLQQRTYEACGGGPVVAALDACKRLGADRVEVLDYKNSGDVWDDRDHVVGYVAAVFADTSLKKE